MDLDLVRMRGKDAVCDSLDVAAHFGKNHRDVLRIIDNLTAQNCAVKEMFRKSTYKADNGQKYRQYYMNRDGFSLLVMGFTGKEAIEWKLKYIEAFNRMEQLLAQKKTEVYKDTRAYQKNIRKQETDAIKRLVDYAAGQGSRNSARYYTSLSRLADKAAGIMDRDQATTEQLGALALVENIIEKCISEGISLQKPYKDIYQDCKQRLEQFRAIAYLN